MRAFVPRKSVRQATVTEPLDGVWLVADAELAGWRLPSTAQKELTLTIRGAEFALGGQRGQLVTHRLDAPSAMDLVTVEVTGVERCLPAIFDQQGDRLRLCLDLAGHARPREFLAPAGTRRFLATYHRAPARGVGLQAKGRVVGGASISSQSESAVEPRT